MLVRTLDLLRVGSAVVLAVLTFLFVDGTLGVWGFMAFLLVTFFLASAGASSAYLTVSEIFRMETRALAIAFFYATGTAVGGITGPFLLGKMIESGEASQVAIAFYLGAAVMAVGGIVELFLRRQGRAGGARGHRQAADRPGRRGGPRARPCGGCPGAQRAAPPARTCGRGGRGRARAATALPPRAGADLLLPRHGRLPSTHRGRVRAQGLGLRARGFDHRARARGPRADRAARAVAAGRARYWGPGRFSAALREAVESGRARRVSRNRFGPSSG